MDPLTHAISGIALARAIPTQRLPTRQIMLLALFSMAPDADIILRLWSDTAYLHYHRGLTHSLLMVPLWGWLIYALYNHSRQQKPVISPYLIGLALLMHILLDLITTFGTMILAPISDWRASLDLVFIIDPLFSACLLIPLLLSLLPRWKPYARQLGILSLGLMFAYLALTYYYQQQAIALAKKEQPNASSYHALPLAFSPFNWQLIASYPDHYMRSGVRLEPDYVSLAALFSQAFVKRVNSSRMSIPDQIDWQRLATMRRVKNVNTLPGTVFYQWFASYPVLLHKNNQHIIFGDLAFGGGADGVPPSFELQVDLISPPSAWLVWHNNRKTKLK